MAATAVVTPSGQLLFGRAVKLTIAPPLKGTFKTQPRTQTAMVIEELRVKFHVVKTLRPEPNTGSVEVYNLSDNSRRQLQGKGARCWLEAGYKTTVAQIFVGDVRYIEHKRDGCDWVTKLELGDGERAYKHGRVNASFKAGTRRADILKMLANQSGLDLGNVQAAYADLQTQEVSGFVAFNSAGEALTKALGAWGLEWSIQSGAIQILPKKGYVPAPAIQLDDSHGLIGAPESGSPLHKGGPHTLKFKSLLQAQIVPGKRIALQSMAQAGVFVAQKVEHDGDTMGGSWETTVEAIPA